jgi:hypothetical protein
VHCTYRARISKESAMTRLVWLALIVFLSACEGRAPSVSDPYDPAKMDLK